MKNHVSFGTAGRPASFEEMGYRKSEQIPDYLSRFGLDAFEYQCGHGLRVNLPSCEALALRSREAGIRISLHTPYYISLSAVEPEKRDNSVRYLLESARVATALGAERMVVHSGSCGKLGREEALVLAKETLLRAQAALDENGYGSIRLCPETMGKVNQLGDLREVLELCKEEERFLPCVDFGHLNARSFGAIRGREEFAAILDAIKQALGGERARSFHAHFSRIAYTEKGGEKAHLTFADETYGPDFEPLMDLLAERGLAPTIICESAGTQAEDAAAMQRHYREALQQAEADTGRILSFF